MHLHARIHLYTVYLYVHDACIYMPTHGGDHSENNYDCQNFQQVLTGVPVGLPCHIFEKHDSPHTYQSRD